ncbi:TA system toxin CbtA family protein [Escherichia coli]
MKKQPVSPTRVASCCLSPAEVWRTLLTHLLAQHYGLTLSDTPFGEEDTIQAHIEAGVPMAEALNAVVEMYDLVRTDRDNAGFILRPYRMLSSKAWGRLRNIQLLTCLIRMLPV